MEFILILNLIVFISLLNLVNFFIGKKSNNLFCGLVGFSGKNEVNLDLIRVLLWYNSLTRGKHATGVFTPKTGIVKDAIEAITFINTDTKFSKIVKDKVLIGHVRHATVGKTDDPESAHPWDFGNIVMQHNGTLKNYQDIAKNYQLKDESWKVDSQVLGLALSNNFETNNNFKVLSEYDGAAAIMLYHKERDSLFVCHDKERPLYYGMKDNTEMYISSIADILSVIGCRDVKSFELNTVYEIKEGQIVDQFRYQTYENPLSVINTKKVAKIGNVFEILVNNIRRWMFDSKMGFTGISLEVVKASMLLGYWVRAKSSVNVSGAALAKITSGKYYFILEADDKNRKVMVLDDEGEYKEVYTYALETELFIPTRDSFVAVTTPFSSYKEGDILKVSIHEYGKRSVLLYDEIEEVFESTTLEHVRLATEEEVKSYLDTVSKSNFIIDFAKNKIMCLPEVTLTNSKSDEVEDIEIEEIDEAIDESDVLMNVIDNLLLLTDNALDECIKSKHNPEFVNKKIEELHSFICDCYDTKFLLNVNENSLKNRVCQK